MKKPFSILHYLTAYIPTVTPSTPSNDGIQVWLIGAIAGGAGAVLLIVCIAICVYCKCCARKHVADDDVEPELMSIEQETTNKVFFFSVKIRHNSLFEFDMSTFNEMPNLLCHHLQNEPYN